MTGLEILEKYPKTAAVVRQFYTDQLVDSLEGGSYPEEFKEFAKAQPLDNEYIAEFINTAPRGLFDVFDENNINIIIHVYTEEPPTKFAFSIAQHDYDHDELYPTRKEAEAAAIEKAFEILNEKL